MTNKLWQTNASTPLHPLIGSYTVGNDFELDQKLLGYDIQASKAHASMLQSIGVLTHKDLHALTTTLDDLQQKWESGDFIVAKEQEDGHTAIEAYLVEKIGDVGKKIHTARSRNDQAMTMMRLYLKDSLQQTIALTKELIKNFAAAAEKAGQTPMPGYTHMQKAMPTTVATWLDSYSDGFLDTKTLVNNTLKIIDQNPLGSAAGFETTLVVDKGHTTKSLEFHKTQENPMYCGLSRGLFEIYSLQALNPIMILAGKFAQDMLLFTTQEFDFFSLPDNFTTGSSIMPQKHNYDVFELMRAKAHIFGSYVQQLQAIVTGTGSGYHRDLQLTKHIALQAFENTQETLKVLNLTVPKLKIHKQTLSGAITPEMHTVAEINQLVSQGMPFRDAYIQIKQQLSEKY